MAKKKSQEVRPNAPELQQVLLSPQPPQNPYYPVLTDSNYLNELPSPPPYPKLTQDRSYQLPVAIGMTRQNASGSGRNVPPKQVSGSRVVVSSNGTSIYVGDGQMAKVSRFNRELFISSILTMGLAFLAFHLLERRNCDYMIPEPFKDFKMGVRDLKEAHIYIIMFGVLPVFLSFLKCITGSTKSYSFYLTTIALVAMIGTAFTGYVAYLSFFSPCTLRIDDRIVNGIKRFVSIVTETEQPIIVNENVFTRVQQDPTGIIVWWLDVSICISYLGILFSALRL